MHCVARLSHCLISCTDLWAFQRDGVVPDFVVLSKTLGAGLPLGAVVTTSAIADAARDAGFLWLTTHLNDPATAAIGVKVKSTSYTPLNVLFDV